MALQREGIETQWYNVYRAQWKPLCTSKTWRIKSSKTGKAETRSSLNVTTEECVTELGTQPKPASSGPLPIHQPHTVSTEETSNRGFSPFALLYQPISLFPLQVITPVCCIQNLLQIQEGNNHQSLWMFSDQIPEEKHCLWLNLHYSSKKPTNVPNEETVWVRITFTKISKWNAAVGWAVAYMHP